LSPPGNYAPFDIVIFNKSTYFVISLGAPFKTAKSICIKWSTGLV